MNEANNIQKEETISNCLNTTVLPKYNCSNCKHFMFKNLEKVKSEDVGVYAIECRNVAHPLQDCVLRGFEAHSEQPGFTNTLNK